MKNFAKYGLLWLTLAFVLRIVFFIMLKIAGSVEWSAFLTILSGIYFDLAVVFFVGATLLVPFLIINWFFPKTTQVLSLVFITFYVVVYCCLMGYYASVTQPLDRVFFIYTSEELYNIVVSSVRFSIWQLLGVLAAVFLYSVVLRLWNRKIQIKPWLAIAYVAVTILFVIVFSYKSLITNGKHYKSHQDYNMAVNQIAYTVNDFYEYYKQSKEEDFSTYDEGVLEDAVAYQRRFPNYNYVDIHYPFLRENDDPDVLGGLLNKTSDGKAPDFVFIIVESLGQRLSASAPKMSFTPFLDSLKREGLYWPNCLALAERTFGVVPNVFSSAPYDKLGFAREWWPIPDHNSILKDMSKNSYSISFYYGGNAAFDGQDAYMSSNGVGYIMNPSEADFDQVLKEEMKNNQCWGMYDRDMFNAAIRHRDTVERNRPNTDIYITLSTHEPFYIQDQNKYIDKVKKMVAETTVFGSREKENVTTNDYMYAAYLYADDCIKQLFEYYESLPEFENTVFVIVGDHRTGRVYVNANPMLAYNVPLIIYSPLVKSPKSFKGVVTHHDIAPTITSYLHNNYDYQIDSECHWLGTSLDTSTFFRCNQEVAFMRNNRDVVQYLYKDYMLDRDRIFIVDTTLYADEIDDDSIKNQLKEYLRQYKNIDWYVTRNDFLLKKPDNLDFLLESEKQSKESVSLAEKGVAALVHPVVFDKNYEKIYVELSFDYQIKSNTDPNSTFVVFKINDSKGNGVLYKAFRFSEMSTESVDGYKLLKVRTTFFVNDKDVASLPMQINLFSPEKLDLEYKDLKIKVEGLPK